MVRPRTFEFDTVYLRDSCTCPRCVDPHSKQKLFRTSDIPESIKVYSDKWVDNVLEIVWRDDLPGYGKDHITRLPYTFFEESSIPYAVKRSRLDLPRPRFWRRETIVPKVFPFIDYGEYMNDDQKLFQALEQLQVWGLVFLKNVPESETSVENIGGRIGPLRDSFYGRTWDVRSVPKATNVAYTHQDLGLHMDLLYMRDPPGLQLLHCLRASTDGGASYFADSFYAAEKIRGSDSSAFEALVRFPVTFEYNNAGQSYIQNRPTVVLEEEVIGHDDRSKHRPIEHVNWSPPFQGRFQVDIGLTDKGYWLRRYLAAAKLFGNLIDSPINQFEYTMKPGECVIFNNRRILHARRAFDGTEGVRWLKGAYLDGDVFLSRLRGLFQKRLADRAGPLDNTMGSVGGPGIRTMWV